LIVSTYGCERQTIAPVTGLIGLELLGFPEHTLVAIIAIFISSAIWLEVKRKS